MIILAARSVFVSFFLGVWLMAWVYGEVVIIDKLVNRSATGADAFIVFWFCAWTSGGLLAVFLWLWNSRGREVILIDEAFLKRRREYIWFSRSRRYQTRMIRNMRLYEIDLSIPEINRGAEFWGLSGGTISFDYGESVQKMGLGIDEQEARQVIESIKARFPFV